jgi:RimJ/RimL family protein N-acetyltransferase
VIETERLNLRDWREDDIEPFVRHTNTPAVMRWLGGVQPEAEARSKLIDRPMRWQSERGFTFWVVERKVDRELLGFCGIKLADAAVSPFPGVHEVGWRLREDAWGQGYAKEAAQASLAYAFEVLAAPRVVALTVIQNEASWGLMERLGMVRRADLDHEDPEWPPEIRTTIVYEMERGAWQSRRS